MALPGRADFDSELRPDLDRYLATDTMEAIERAKLFHLAWDISCSAFGSRQLHYERFFAGDAVRNAQILINIYDRDPRHSDGARVHGAGRFGLEKSTPWPAATS